MNELTDEQLMARVQAGDLAAFEVLVERFKRIVYSMAFAMLRSREDAEEAAQDTFVKLFRARHQYDAERQLEPWLLRIAGNTCRDTLRRRRTERLPVSPPRESDKLAQLAVDPQSFGREWNESTRQAIRHELGQLSDKLRLPLLLKYLNEFTNRQIAESLGISVSNVKVRLARAKDVLHGRLERVLES